MPTLLLPTPHAFIVRRSKHQFYEETGQKLVYVMQEDLDGHGIGAPSAHILPTLLLPTPTTTNNYYQQAVWQLNQSFGASIAAKVTLEANQA